MQFWSGDHLAIEVSGPGGASEVVVQHPYALIGALARADVRLSGDGVQKREALLYALDGKIMCRRLEAALPEAYCDVAEGEWLPLGKHRLRARIIRNQNDTPPVDLDARPRIPVLRVRHKARASVNRRLYKTIETVGRGGDCELELRCPQASLYHCVLLREANRLWCIDLGSGNGTLLNGQRIECAPVEIGGKLRVGDFELEFQRYSRRSGAPLSSDSASGSNLSLNHPLREERLAELVSPDENDVPPGESVFGSRIVNSNATLHSPTSSLSRLAALPAPVPEGLQLPQDKQSEILATQAELMRKFEAVSAENVQLRANQETFSQEIARRLEEQRSTLAEELLQRSQAERRVVMDDVLLRMQELRDSTAHELSIQIESLKQSLQQQWQSHQLQSHESAARELVAQGESMRQALSQELSDRLDQWSQSCTVELSQRAEALQESVARELQERLESLTKAMHAESRAQRDALSQELLQRLDDLATSQTQQVKLQSEAQRHALTQELTRRLNAALEGRLQQPQALSGLEQQVVSAQWLQRLDDLRSSQSDEIALAVSAQAQALSQQLTQRMEELRTAQSDEISKALSAQGKLLSQQLSAQLDDLQKTLTQDLARQIEEQRQALLHDVSREVDTGIQKTRGALAESQQDVLHEWQEKTARTLTDAIQQQREVILQELARQSESDTVGTRDLLAQSSTQLHDELSDQLAKLVAARFEELRQSLSQDLLQQVQLHHSTLSQELLTTLEMQRSTATDQQQAQTETLNQRIKPLEASLNQLLAQQSQLISRLSAQADELKATRRELQELQLPAVVTPLNQTLGAEPDSPPIELVDTSRQANVASLDSGVLGATNAAEPEFDELPQATSVAVSTISPEAIQRRPAPIDEDDPLLHFVSDRLAQLDTGRQRRTVLYWSLGIAAVALLAVLAWALFTWLPGYLQQS